MFRILILSLFLCIKMVADTESIDITRADIEHAVKSLSEQQDMEKDARIKKLLRLSADERAEFIKNYELQMEQLDGQGGMGIDTLVFDVWYVKSEKSIFRDEKERKKFERAMKDGVLVGIHEKKGFAVLMINGKDIYIIPSSMEGADMLAQSIQGSLQKAQEESQEEFEAAQQEFNAALESAEKIVQEAQGQKDKKKAQALLESAEKIFTQAQEKMAVLMESMLTKVCDQHFEDLGDGFLYDTLFIRVYGKVAESWMPDVIKAVKLKSRKN